MRTLAFQSIASAARPYLVVVHTAEQPAQDEWNEYVSAVTAAAKSAVEKLYAFVVTDGGGPNSTQRKEIADAFASAAGGAVTHVFTTSAFVRGIVTAFHWMNWSPAVAHHPHDFGKVCAGCGLSPVEVLRVMAELKPLLAPVQTLRQIEDTMSSSIWKTLR